MPEKMKPEARARANDRFLTTLGLCARAGALIFGTDLICDAMRDQTKGKKPILVIEASDTSARTHKKLTDKCSYYQVRHITVEYDAAKLSAALGRPRRIAAVGVTDTNLGEAVLTHIDGGTRAH